MPDKRVGQIVAVFASSYREFAELVKEDAALMGIDSLKPKAVSGSVKYPTSPPTWYLWSRDRESAWAMADLHVERAIFGAYKGAETESEWWYMLRAYFPKACEGLLPRKI